MPLTKLFIAERIPERPLVGLVAFAEGSVSSGSTLFTTGLTPDFAFTRFQFVSSISDADYVLVPHAVTILDAPTRSYLDRVRREAAGVPILVFVGGDLSHDLFINDMIVLKGSQYRYLKRPNEIIVPPFIEDVRTHRALVVRTKGDRPVVGFCGWADFRSWVDSLKSALKHIAMRIRQVGNPHALAHTKGVYVRRRALRALGRSPGIVLNAVVRSSFSGNTKTIGGDVSVMREEYLANMEEADLVLAPKGDANFSLRFYEALAMGRIPLLIDTECCLAGEEWIPYDRVLLRVPLQDVDCIDSYIESWWKTLSSESYFALQSEARSLFERFVRFDAFFNTLFATVLTPERAQQDRAKVRKQLLD